MKKILLIILGGILFMTTITGCSNTPNRKSKEEIEGLFSDFLSVFSTEKNLDYLYDKEGYSSNLPEGDLGSWVLASYVDQWNKVEYDSKGIQLIFNRNVRKCRGYYIVGSNKYPIKYENGIIELNDKNVSLDIKNEVSNFKLLFDVIGFDETYLNLLQSKRHFYNNEVPLYGISYYLPVDDKNRIALKTAYPNFPHHDKEVFLELEGTGRELWNTTNSIDLRVMYDKEGYNFFSASMDFSSTDKFSELFAEE